MSRSQVPDILSAARPAAPFCSPSGQAFAALPDGPLAHRAVPLRSPLFRLWLAQTYREQFEDFPSRNALRHALDLLEAEARFGRAPAAPVHARLAFTGDPHQPESVILDLDHDGAAVEITPAGWTLTDAPGPLFRRRYARAPLPAPERNHPAALEELRSVLNLAPHHWTVLAAWLAAAFRPAGPYPILVLRGPSACGKSTLASVLRAVLDAPGCLPVPHTVAALEQLAATHWILAFDELPPLSPALASALARIASGTSLANPAAHGEEPTHTALCRPVILTLPDSESAALPRMLAERAVIVDLPALEPARRRPEGAIHAAFQRLHAPVLAQLCDAVALAVKDAVALAVKNETAQPYAEHTRFPAQAHWAVACAPALGLEPELAARALAAGPAHPVAHAISHLLRQHPHWTGTASQLHTALAARHCPALPANARALSELLRRILLPGIALEFARGSAASRTRTITLTAAPSRTPETCVQTAGSTHKLSVPPAPPETASGTRAAATSGAPPPIRQAAPGAPDE